MILSFHPIFEGDKNILCAGREPGADDLAAVRAADAVIIPQGCKASLYTMARENCANVFPNYDARFEYPGKIGQTRLFRKLNAPHPKTEIYTSHSSFLTSHFSVLTSFCLQIRLGRRRRQCVFNPFFRRIRDGSAKSRRV